MSDGGMAIVPGIFRLTGLAGTRPLHLYLLRGDERIVLLDTGYAPDPERLVFPALALLGLRPSDLDLVINSHADADHCHGNAAVKRANPRLWLTCGQADRDLMADPPPMWSRRYNAYAAQHDIAPDPAECRRSMSLLGDGQPMDMTWRGGETLRLGRDWVVEIHHTPGHTAGHLTIFDPRSRVALTGDAVQGAAYCDTSGRPALCPVYLDVDAYLATIQYLRDLHASPLAGSHWPVKYGAAQVALFLDETEHYVHTVERVLLQELARRPEGVALRELIAAAGPPLGNWPRPADRQLASAFAAPLVRLAAQCKVTPDDGRHPVTYRRAGGPHRWAMPAP